jgi:TRAP-type C4-dicarboxylate transport system permease small subunit
MLNSHASASPSTLTAWLRPLHWIEDAVLVLSVVALAGIALLQISLRNFFDSGLPWAESATQMLVLWSALLGALRASRDGAHIAVDVLTHYTDGMPRKVMIAAALLFSASICFVAAWYSADFVALEREDGSLGLLRQPLWIYESIIPLALALIGVRFVVQTVRITLHPAQNSRA